jgi:hypothetical protein
LEGELVKVLNFTPKATKGARTIMTVSFRTFRALIEGR